MLPPRKAPNVTAGFTWPPEMFAPTETATNSANPCANAAAISPEGVDDPSFVNLPAEQIKFINQIICISKVSQILKLLKIKDF